ncbi:MAG TPA: winged helix-turn-helix domain-containing protein [Candidatus Eremiobacteraceae bacterium]|nr:winged helix-turn-helix domain-containing protein [Candidatus Eremiobacteraceae bacterium]
MSQDGSNSPNGARLGALEYSFGPYRMRTDDMILYFRDAAVPLAPKVAQTLLALLERAGRVVSKEELLETVWGGAAIEDANLSQNIYTLRRQFEATAGESLIETLPRRGYRFAGRVRRAAPDRRGRRRSLLVANALLAAATACAGCGAALIVFASTVGVRAPVTTAPPALAASQAYWTGWLYYREGTDEGFRTALRSFKQAADLQPSDPRGAAGEAMTYASLADSEGDSPSAVADSAHADWLAYHVLANHRDSAAALAAKGFVEFDIDGAFAAATRDLRRAEHLDPQSAPSYIWYGSVLLWQGRLSAAREQLSHATRLDSSLPSLDYLLAWDYYFSRDFDNAIAFAKLAIADPWTENAGRLLLAAADEGAGRFKPAIAAVADLAPGPTDDIAASATRAHVYATMGDRVDAARELRTVERLSERYKQRPLLTAVAYLANGRLDETFAWLSRLSQIDRTVLEMDPRLDRARQDPRFSKWLHG